MKNLILCSRGLGPSHARAARHQQHQINRTPIQSSPSTSSAMRTEGVKAGVAPHSLQSDSLEQYLGCELQLSRRECGCDGPKRGAIGDIAVRRQPVGVVEKVERLRPQVEFYSLGHKRKLLMQSKICVVVRERTQAVTRNISPCGGISVARKRRIVIAGVGSAAGQISCEPAALLYSVDVARRQHGDGRTPQRRAGDMLRAEVDQIRTEYLTDRRSAGSIQLRRGCAARGTRVCDVERKSARHRVDDRQLPPSEERIRQATGVRAEAL